MSMRDEFTLTIVTPRLQEMDFTGFLQGVGVAVIFVPSTCGRLEFRMRTGMFFSTAGNTVENESVA